MFSFFSTVVGGSTVSLKYLKFLVNMRHLGEPLIVIYKHYTDVDAIIE